MDHSGHDMGGMSASGSAMAGMASMTASAMSGMGHMASATASAMGAASTAAKAGGHSMGGMGGNSCKSESTFFLLSSHPSPLVPHFSSLPQRFTAVLRGARSTWGLAPLVHSSAR